MATADVDVAARPRQAAPAAVAGHPRRRLRPARVMLNVFLTATALAWLAPLLWTVYTSLRPYEDTAVRGYVSLPGKLNFDSFVNAWSQAQLPPYYLNTLLVVVPAVVLTLMFASFVAFVVSRFDIRLNLALLMVFSAGNLLPPQVIITPLYRMHLKIPLPYWMNDLGTLYDSYWGIIVIHVAFQLGFCIFVLSNYMKTIPYELTEAALVDGASVWRQFWRIILPLCRPALAALPTLIVYFLLQRQFVRGLTLGATKG